MRTPLLVSIVVGAHCIAVGSVFLIQGCGTTKPGPVTQAPVPVMPADPAERDRVIEPARPIVPIVRPGVKTWPDETTIYVVKKGDALSIIARRYGISMAEIMALNRIGNADKIRLGQKLVLPGRVDLDSPVKPDTTRRRPSRPASDAEGLYVVKAGDVISRLAVKFGTTTKAIRQANGLTGDKILVGQKLVIPGATPERPVPVSAGPAVVEPDLPEMDLDDALEEDMSAVPVSPEAPVSPEVDAEEFRKHTVAEGEDLYSVSLMWDVGVEELKRVNGLTETSLVPGRVLRIPMAD